MAEEDKTLKEDKTAKESKEIKPVSDTKDENKGMPEWLTPILSALGGMGGSYMLFIKPLQDRMDALANQVNDLRGEVKKLRHQNKELEEDLGEIQGNQNNPLNGYLPVRKTIAQGSYVKKRL